MIRETLILQLRELEWLQSLVFAEETANALMASTCTIAVVIKDGLARNVKSVSCTYDIPISQTRFVASSDLDFYGSQSKVLSYRALDLFWLIAI